VEQLEEVIIPRSRDFGIEGKRDALTEGLGEERQDRLDRRGDQTMGLLPRTGPECATDLSYFDLIDPCGLEGVKMTSMERILRTNVSRDDCIGGCCCI